jgi:hypothetical protein
VILIGLYEYDKMKVIWHQTPRQYFTIGLKIFLHFSYKKTIVGVRKKDPSTIISSIVDVEELVVVDIHYADL